MSLNSIQSEIQKLNPSSIVEMFILDASSFGAGIFYFHAGTNNLMGNLVWQGQTYIRYPVEVTGFELTGQGQNPRPVLKVSNYLSAITALLIEYGDLIGAKITRKRTLVKYLDSANFYSLNPTEDQTTEFPPDIFYIDRKAIENREFVQFELASSIDLVGVKIPARQIIQNLCSTKYKGPECGYAGSNYFTADDTPTTDPTKDVCGKRLSSCKCRFGATSELSFMGFPASGLYK